MAHEVTKQASPLSEALHACASGEANMDRLAELERQYNTDALCFELDRALRKRTEAGDQWMELDVSLSHCAVVNSGEHDHERHHFKIAPHDNMESITSMREETFEKLLEVAQHPSNTHFHTTMTTRITMTELIASITGTPLEHFSSSAGGPYRNWNTPLRPHQRTWFSACVEELTQPKEGPEYSRPPLDAPFISQGLTLARALLQMGHTRVSPRAGRDDADGDSDNDDDLWAEMRYNGLLGHSLTNWSIMRGLLSSFIAILERLQATHSVYLHILAPHENDINCALSGGLIQ